MISQQIDYTSNKRTKIFYEFETYDLPITKIKLENNLRVL